jgi:hypothetical protein
MSCALNGDEPNLIAYYNFEQGVAGANNAGLNSLVDRQDECTPDNGLLLGFALNGATSNWVAPGATISTNCTPLYPNINLVGNSVCIDNGDVTPSLADHTSFGDFGYTPLTRTFTIQNTGDAIMSVTLPFVISGPDAVDFTVTTDPATVVGAQSSTTFVVTFNPAGATGAKNAVIEISSNDADEPLYTFAVSGVKRVTGKALSFDGINDTVYLPVPLSGSYTKEVWINTAQLTGTPNLITGTGTALYLDNGRIAAGHSATFTHVLDPTPIVANEWTHVAVTYNAATNDMFLYKNGVQVASNLNVPTYTEPSLRLGTFASFSFYSGIMDEVRIWNSVRSVTDIANNRFCELTGDEPFLHAYYDFNQGAALGANPGDTILLDRSDKCIPLNGVLHNFGLTGAFSNWVDPGGSVVGDCAPTFPNIAVSGNTVCITAGDNTPSTVDNTDWGVVDAAAGVQFTYTITNTGTAPLTITNVTITGPDGALFTVDVMPSSPVAVGGTTTFTIGLINSIDGTYNATINVLNNDTDEASYSFDIVVVNETTTPVTLLLFNGILKGAIVDLNWKTSSEINNRGFEVLRSNSAQTSWEKVGFVAGKNVATESNYSLTDYAPLKGINVYKLRQLDFDGVERFSNLVNINNTDKSVVISTYPNPFTDKINVIFNDVTLLNTIAQVRSITGVTVATVMLNNYRKEIGLNKLAAGTYFISFANGQVIRVVKQ